MKNHETTLKNRGNQPKTMKNHETILKNHGNQPESAHFSLQTDTHFIIIYISPSQALRSYTWGSVLREVKVQQLVRQLPTPKQQLGSHPGGDDNDGDGDNDGDDDDYDG